MNVLINAYAVSPNWGSEQGMGWNWVVNIARYCNVVVITEGEWRKEIEMVLPSLEQRDNIHFFYIPVSERVRSMCWNQGDWRFYFYYRKWQKRALNLAQSIIGQEHIDVIHQLNMVGFREPGYLWKIKNIPYFWGPLCGMEMTSLRMMGGESLSHKLFQLTKNFFNYLQIHCSIRVRKAVSRSSFLIAATKSTYQVLSDTFGRNNVVFINETGTEIGDYCCKTRNYDGEVLELLWIGRFTDTKKLDLALSTIALLKEEQVHLSIAGTGNETQMERYHLLSEKLGINNMVTWLGKVPHEEIRHLMKTSDLLFFTSILEATSTVVPEAISNNLPILCFNICGFGPLVKDRVGETVEISTPSRSITQFAEIIKRLNHNRKLLIKYSAACDKYKRELSWQWKAEKLSELYNLAVSSNLSNYFNINYEFNISRIHDAIERRLIEEGADYICVADGNILQMVHKDEAYREVVNGGMFSICDSSWVPLFLKQLYGMEVPQYCGSQIFKDVVESKKYRMFFLGTSDSILRPLKENLAATCDARIAGMQFVSLPFCKVEDFDYPAIAEMINSDNPDIIWVALGAPKQEYFMHNLKPYLNRGVMIAVGAVFKFFSGTNEKRAPKWMVKGHIEFIYRILQDPKKQLFRCRNILVTLPSVLRAERRRKNGK